MIPGAWPFWTPGAWLANAMKRTTRHCHILNIIISCGIQVLKRRFFLLNLIMSMGACNHVVWTPGV